MIFIIVILVIVIIYLIVKLNDIQSNCAGALTGKYKEEIDAAIAKANQYVILKNEKQAQYEESVAALDNELTKRKSEYQERQLDLERQQQTLSKQLEITVANQQKIIDEKLKNYWEIEIQKLNEEYEEQFQKINEELDCVIDNYNECATAAQDELDGVYEQLEDWRNRQQAINDEALRQEQLSKEWEKYHLMLSDAALDDCNNLFQLARTFNNKQVIYKLIWSEYVLPQFNKMIKLQFGKSIPKNVIYMISIGDKKYIGKTKQEVSKRWTEHLKSSLYINGSITQEIHKAINENLSAASFQILEDNITEDKLGEREKFYIKHYQTDIYGYNMVSGG